MKSLAIINQSAPHGDIGGRESLDLVLASASYDTPLALFFIGDGLWQLVPGQQPSLAGAKNYSKTFGLLELYDVDTIYLCEQSLAQRGLEADDLLLDGELLSPAAINDKLSQFDHVLSF